jgi:hypothetical protein
MLDHQIINIALHYDMHPLYLKPYIHEHFIHYHLEENNDEFYHMN